MQKKALNSLFLAMLIVVTAIAAPLIGESNYLVSAAYAANSPASAPMAGTWTVTGNLNTARSQYTATLLTNGKVLVAAGHNEAFLNSAELYDPATGTWTATGDLNTGRACHTATLLTNGKVLVVGGLMYSAGNVYLNSAELYDPASGTWTATGSFNTARENHTATLLANGKVLVAGGDDGYNFFNSAALYTPVLPPHTITATAGPNGAISPSGQVSINDGDSQTFTITPNSGYRVDQVLVDGISVSPRRSYTFTDVTADHTITASFAKGGILPYLQLLMSN